MTQQPITMKNIINLFGHKPSGKKRHYSSLLVQADGQPEKLFLQRSANSFSGNRPSIIEVMPDGKARIVTPYTPEYRELAAKTWTRIEV